MYVYIRTGVATVLGFPTYIHVRKYERVNYYIVLPALNIQLLEPLAQGASRFEKSLAPPKNPLAPNFSKYGNGILNGILSD